MSGVPALLSWVQRGASKRIRCLTKEAYQLCRGSGRQKTLIFIVGCQRSGTTLMTRLFEKDFNAKVYGEYSELSSGDHCRMRLDPLPVVERKVAAQRFPLVVAKPLVESQNTDALLDYFREARALWLYRHYRDVAASDLAKFGTGNGVRNLSAMVEAERGNWRSERLTGATRDILAHHYSPDMNPYDAAALFWFARNQIFFDLTLHEHPRVALVRYEDLVAYPAIEMERIYSFCGCQFPGDRLVQEVTPASVGKGGAAPVSPPVAALCDDLLRKLDGYVRPEPQLGKAG